MPLDKDSFLLEEYKLGVGYLTAQFSRMWTRFNFFITLEAALTVALIGLFKDKGLSSAALLIPAVALLISVCWYIIGAQDRFLVEAYRGQIAYTVERLVPPELRPWPHIGSASEEVEARTNRVKRTVYQWRWEPLSVTKLAALFPVLVTAVWSITLLAMIALLAS